VTILNKKYCNFLFLSSVLLVLFISFGCNNTNQKKSYTVQEFSYSTKNDSAKIQSITEADTLGEYTFKNVILEPKGRPTQGGLIVSKGELKDTIYMLLKMSDELPPLEILSGTKQYEFELNER